MILEWPSQERREYGEYVVRRNNRRARNRGLRGELTAGCWIRCLKAHSEKCVYCERHADTTRRPLTCDHFIPLALRGESVVYNIVPACMDCNQIKGNLHPAIWLLWRFGEAGASRKLAQIQQYFDSL